MPAGVSVERQEVHIAIYSVRLAYVFKSATRQTLHFSFAMPAMPVDAGEDLAALDENSKAAGLAADTQPANYLRLSVSVNGRKPTLAGRGRALLEGKDVTRRLQDAGVPLLSGPDGEPMWRQLPPEKQAGLEADGLMSGDSAQWSYQADFTWDTVLALGETRVEVSYAPVFRYWSDINLDLFPEMAADGSATRAYCIDRAVRRAFLSGKPRYELYTVTHLAPPDGWRGPARLYRLVVDKGAPTDLVAFCPQDAKKISPTRFEWTARNHTPGGETGVMFFARPDAASSSERKPP
ncbi:DUF4424 family protein [Bosea sp. (in: a-proteobacteria)]|uniref:DUF4424 family protein n=1 Tax=Bosea sp. (in: a-proteobacteria) TaxID=1871050 RepID=UPI002634E88F|nr:DUF4424 family protein [Bosea sp. (in: a-proteobacteria)]MCO5091722.1 DUF4424 domain-containing protein [Bosea sp. (in: a-proteobacteria)]